MPGETKQLRVTAQLFGIGVLSLTWGCTDSSDGVAVTEVDSAGVRIVTSAGSAVLDSGWSVSSVPRLEVGSLDGPDATRLFRVADAVRLPEGGIAVADGGSQEIRVFAASGRHVASFGGQGAGPGEFQMVTTLALTPNETLVAYDRQRFRVSEFSKDGTLVGTTEVGAQATSGEPVLPTGLVPTRRGTLVGRAGSDLSSAPGTGLTQDTATWIRVDPAIGVPEVLVRVPGAWSLRFEMRGRGSYRLAPMTARPSWDVSADQLVVTGGASFEIRLADVDGGLREVWRRTEPRRAITSDVIQEWKEDFQRVMEIPESERPFLQEFFHAMTYPDSLPTYSQVRIDPDGYVWAERFEVFELSGQWDLYSDEGEFLGIVTLPADLRVLEIGRDFVLGVREDELGVEYVQEFELVRPAR